MNKSSNEYQKKFCTHKQTHTTRIYTNEHKHAHTKQWNIQHRRQMILSTVKCVLLRIEKDVHTVTLPKHTDLLCKILHCKEYICVCVRLEKIDYLRFIFSHFLANPSDIQVDLLLWCLVRPPKIRGIICTTTIHFTLPSLSLWLAAFFLYSPSASDLFSYSLFSLSLGWFSWYVRVYMCICTVCKYPMSAFILI